MKSLKLILSISLLISGNIFGRTCTVENDTNSAVIVIDPMSQTANYISPKKTRSVCNNCPAELMKRMKSIGGDCLMVLCKDKVSKQFVVAYGICPKTDEDITIKMSQLPACLNNPNDKFEVCVRNCDATACCPKADAPACPAQTACCPEATPSA